MEIGTAEIIENIKEPQRHPGSGFFGGSGSNGGGRNNGGGGSGGGSDDSDDTTDKVLIHNAAKSRILTSFLLMVVLMTFGGLMAAYIVIATNKVVEWQPFALPLPVWISTAIILASSLVYFLAERSTYNNQHKSAKKWLIATTVLGSVFISSQILAWIELNNRGVYAEGNPYAGFFYILTAVHALHVIGGIIALSTILLRSWHPPNTIYQVERRKTLAQVVGWYWHFMGLLWIVIFVLLGFWK